MVNTARVQQKSVTSRGAVTAPRRLAGRITKPKALPRMTAKKLREQYGEQGWIFVDEPGAGDDGVAIELGGFFKLVRDSSSARDNGDWEGSFVTCFDFDEPPFERWLSVHAGPPRLTKLSVNQLGRKYRVLDPPPSRARDTATASWHQPVPAAVLARCVGDWPN